MAFIQGKFGHLYDVHVPRLGAKCYGEPIQHLKAAVVGHSFVKSTRDWCRSRRLPRSLYHDVRKGRVQQGAVNAHLLRLERPYRSIDLLTTPLVSSVEMDGIWLELQHKVPDVVVINGASNDIVQIMKGKVKGNRPRTPQALADAIYWEAVKMRKAGVAVVIIMSSAIESAQA